MSATLLFLKFLLLFLPIGGEEPEPELAIRRVNDTLDLGYCFGGEYAVAYKRGPNGDRLLGNSSSEAKPVPLPARLRDRVQIDDRERLSGLQMRGLVPSDSGVYLRECWRNRTRVGRRSQALLVCERSAEPQKVAADRNATWTRLRCRASEATEGTTVRWYFDAEGRSGIRLVLDTAVSPPAVPEELRDQVAMENGGRTLLIRDALFRQKEQFYCVVSDGDRCLAFQILYQPVRSERRSLFASAGDRVELSCPLESRNQLWETPLGNVNASAGGTAQMHLSAKAGDFSLLIPAVSYRHGGEYSCVAAALDLQYSLSLCPRGALREKSRRRGADVSLECQVGRETPKRVLWFREEPSGRRELVHDSQDDSVEVPEDLRGRTSWSEKDFSLRLSDARQGDGGFYWCVALGETDYDYADDYGDDYGEYADGQYWYQTPRCIFKQENHLIWAENTPEGSQLAAGAAGGSQLAAGAAAMAILGGVVAVALIKRSRKKDALQSRLAAADVKVNVECSQKLNPT